MQPPFRQRLRKLSKTVTDEKVGNVDNSHIKTHRQPEDQDIALLGKSGGKSVH